MSLTINNLQNQNLANTYDNESKRGIIIDYSTDKLNYNAIKGYIVGNPTIQLNRNLCECNANISINYYEDMGTDCLKHKLDNLTRVLMIPNATSSNYQPTFDTTTRKPLNHYQYVICKGQMLVNGGASKLFKHAYALVEPIYLTRYVYVGTHSHTNMTNIKVKYANTGDTYDLNQDSTNLWEILKRELQLSGYKTTLEDTSWFSKCNFIPSDITLLQNSGIGSNEVFTSATLYDVLLKIGLIIDRIPKLYFNPDYDPSSTDASKREFILCFEEKELSNIAPHEITDLMDESISYSESSSQGNDADTIVCDAQNVQTTDSIWYPSENGYLPLTGSTDELVLTTSSNFSIKVPKKIKCVETVEIMKTHFSKDNTDVDGTYEIVKSTAKCFEYNEWLNQDKDVRKTSFYFKNDSNEINIPDAFNPKKNTLLFSAESTQYFFRIKFTPIINLRTSYGDRIYQTVISQSESSLDAYNFGEYLKNYAKSKNGDDIFKMVKYDSYNAIIMPGERISIDGEMLYIHQSNITVENNAYLVQYSISKKRIKNSELIDASSIKDISTIDRSKSFDRLDLIEDSTIYCSLVKTYGTFNQSIKYASINAIISGFVVENNTCPNSALLTCSFDTYNGTITHNDSTTSTGNYTKPSIYLSVPFVKTIIGNSIYYNIEALDNLYFCVGGGYILKGVTTVLSNNAFNRYTDDFGKIKTMTITFSNASNAEDFKNITSSSSTSDVNTAITNYKNNMIAYPIVDSTDAYTNEAVFIPSYRVLKDTNEKLNISYKISFEPNEDSQLNKTFISALGLIYNYSMFQKFYIGVISKTDITSFDINNRLGNFNIINPSLPVNVKAISSITKVSTLNGTVLKAAFNSLSYTKGDYLIMYAKILNNDLLTFKLAPMIMSKIKDDSGTISECHLLFETK